ncbi:MAG: hypothetical protein J7L96_09030 [Bacteroidales bacterium]|nr:hypothetical protein [Bacteroidales bacterium]
MSNPKLKPLKFNPQKLKLTVVFVLIVGGIVGGLVFVWINSGPSKQPPEVGKQFLEEEKFQKQPKKIFPLPHGKQSYAIITDNPKNPQILRVVLDPLDVKQGERQVVTVEIKYENTNTVTSNYKVFITYKTDNTTTTIPLKLKKLDGSPLIGIWEGVWEPEDSYESVYIASVRAISDAGESKVDLSFR